MKPKICIIIPTHNRCASLQRTLSALNRQQTAANSFEVIVVADGCRDDTATMVTSFQSSYQLRLIQQPPSGAAAARNRGAEAASAPLILFLDDDMEASPQLVAEHLNMHHRHPGGLVIGYFTTPRQENSNNLLAVDIGLWWGDRFSEIAKKSHRFTFQDVFTGNLSLTRCLFIQVGQFDERFHGKAGEDYEFGWRLQKHHILFRFASQAASFHNDTPSLKRFLRRGYAEGRGHILITQKHPELLRALPLIQGIEGGPWVKIGRWILLRPWMLRAFPKFLKIPLLITNALMFRQRWKRLLRFMKYCVYWQGVYAELGSTAEFQRFMNDIPFAQSDYVEMELDLETDLERLDDILAGDHIDAICLRYRTTPIGRIAPTPGAEPLRPEHVRHAIVNWWGYNYFAAQLHYQHEASDSLIDVALMLLPRTADTDREPLTQDSTH
jgi:glycosyltransferase involved in cell wall biosynthesis